MDNNQSNWQTVGLGIIFLGILCWLGAWVTVNIFGHIAHAPWQFISILVAFLGAIITFASNYTSQIRNEQRDNKVRIYQEITTFLSKVFYSLATDRPHTRQDIKEFAITITPSILMWGSDGVVNSFLQFLESDEPLEDFEKMMLEIRKDLGHNNKLSENLIIRIFNCNLPD
jgi:hypothetical protein